MATIPTKRDLGPLAQVAGAPRFTPAQDFTGEAMTGLGQTLQRGGGQIGLMSQEEALAAAKAIGWQKDTAFADFRAKQLQANDDALRNAQPGAPGLSKGVEADFDTRAAEFMKGMPGPLQEGYKARLIDLKSSLAGRAREFETKERSRFEGNKLDQDLATIYSEAARDPSKIAEVRARAEDHIRKFPFQTPIEADQRLNAVPDSLAKVAGPLINSDKDKNASVFSGGGNAVDQVVSRIIGVESGGDPNAKNPNSSASGLGQFIDSTWVATLRQHRPDIAAGKSAAQMIALKSDPALSREMTKAYTQDNAEFLTNRGVQTTAGNLYLAHFLGPAGAVQALKADPNASVSTVLGQDVVRANSFLAGKTIADLRAWSDKKMGEAAGEPTIGQAYEYWADKVPGASPETLQALAQQSLSYRRQFVGDEKVQAKADIDLAVANAPSAIQNTGSYSGETPGREKFLTAYGPAEGEQRYQQYTTAVETSRQAFDMRTMSADQITSIMRAAEPKSSGDDAALEAARYDALAGAAKQTLEARKADPVAYVRSVFPNVERAWMAADQPGGMQAALSATAAAQTQLGISSPKLLPGDLASNAVTAFADMEKPLDERVAAVSQILLSTPDPGQRATIFKQMVGAGLPAMSEGAFDAMARGDTSAARRLFQASMLDPSKLPGKLSDDPAGKPDERIQALIMDPGQIGDAVYGLSIGLVDNTERAERDKQLITNSVELRRRQGQGLDDAIKSVVKDLYGNIQVVSGNSRVNALVPAPADADADAVLDGLDRLAPDVRKAIEEQGQIITPAPAPKGLFPGIEPGNIDLGARPVVHNSDGTISTVQSMSFEEDGTEVLIPKISPSGKTLSDAQAIDLYRKTGQHLGKFTDAKAASAYAKELHQAQENFYSARETGSAAIIHTGIGNATDIIMKEGTWRATGNGYSFTDPYSGLAVAGRNGKPLVFSLDDVLKAGAVPGANNALDAQPDLIRAAPKGVAVSPGLPSRVLFRGGPTIKSPKPKEAPKPAATETTIPYESDSLPLGNPMGDPW